MQTPTIRPPRPLCLSRLRLLPLALGTALLLGSLLPAQATSRTWTYTYHPNGLPASVDGPRTDVADTTSYSYDALGRRTQVQNALGHSTTLSNFDIQGRPQTITDANGIATTLTYTPQGWLATSTTAGSTTGYTYDGAGQLLAISLGDGSWLEYTWDDARRLTAVENNLGERIEYTLDAQGNRTAEAVRDSTGTLRRQQQWVFDALGRLLRHVGVAGQTTHYSYDLNHNLVGITTPNAHSYTQSFDALGRLVGQTDPLAGHTSQTYDAQDNPTQVVDPRGVTTSYTYNGLGDLIEQNSPDSGSTSYAHDAAGNTTQRIDARGVATLYTYDALNRPLTGSYPSAPALNVQYGYDDTSAGNHGQGRLTSITDASGTLAYRYDAQGRLTQQTRTLQAVQGQARSDTLGYAYDLAGRIAHIDYPAGLRVLYQRNTGGQVHSVSLQVDGTSTVPIISSASYQPFGPLKALTWGNGLQLTRSHDQDYRLSSQSIASLWNSTYSYDANGNITEVEHSPGSTLQGTQAHSYDALDRLTHSEHLSGLDGHALGYTYDATGNRTARTWADITGGTTGPGTSTALGYDTDSNRLTSIGNQNVTTDSAGHLLQDRAQRSYTHDAQGRLQAVNINGLPIASYTHNALGQRTHKHTPYDGSTTYLYGQDGQLLGWTRYSAASAQQPGQPTQAQYYLWLGSQPIAAVQVGYNSLGSITSTDVLYLHTDHLDTPRLATNASQTVVWKLPPHEPFGTAQAQQDPDQDGIATDIPLRFAGQVFDADTGLHYNYFRDYDPWTGRYIQSDPIGLEGGLNTYGYVGGNPLRFIDPKGLAIPAPVIAVTMGGIVIATANACQQAWNNISHRFPNWMNSEGDNTLEPGPYAGDSIPARGPNRDFTEEERDSINEIGDATGCHTCGSSEPGTKGGNWVPDHQPPNSLNPDDKPQRLYPHCLSCSRRQGGQIRGNQIRKN